MLNFNHMNPTTPTISPEVRDSISRQLEEAKNTALKIQEGVRALGEKEKATVNASNIVRSSDAVVQNEKNTTSLVKMLSVPSVGETQARQASDNYVKMIEAQMKALEKRRAQEIDTINSKFDETEKAAKKEQEREVGTTNVALMRTGGFLGTQISGVGVLNNLAASHRSDIAALQVKRTAAINEANSAIDDKQFRLAQLKADEAKAIDKEINDRRNKFFDQSLKIIEEDRQAEASRATASSKLRDDARSSLSLILSNFGAVGLENLDEGSRAALEELAGYAGVPPTLLSTPTIRQKAQVSLEKQREISNAIARANLALRQQSVDIALERFEMDKKIDESEASRLGLPRTLVGYTEDQLESDLDNDAVPSWFAEYQIQQGLITDINDRNEYSKLDDAWFAFRNKVLSTNPLIDFGGLGLPPPITDTDGASTENLEAEVEE